MSPEGKNESQSLNREEEDSAKSPQKPLGAKEGKIMKYLPLIAILLVFGCSGGSEDEAPSGFRALTEEEYVVWELTVGCFMDNGGPFWQDMGYVEPYIKEDSEISVDCPAPGSIACAPRDVNGIVVDTDFYYTENGINKSILVHEFKHVILRQGGSRTWDNHDNFFFSESSPCPDGMLNTPA